MAQAISQAVDHDVKAFTDHVDHAEPLKEEPEAAATSAQPQWSAKSAEEKKLVRKIDLFLMPTIWILYLLSYMLVQCNTKDYLFCLLITHLRDRTNIGNAKTAGMADDLGLTDDQYSLAVTTFQIGYVIAGPPSNMILSRVKPSIYIPILMILWGTVVAILAVVKTPAQLLGLRFLLGVMEAGFSPAVLFIISSWYRKHEQSKRFMTFLSAGILSGAFGGIVAGAIASGMDGRYGIAAWKWLFIVEGVCTIGVAFGTPLVLLDYPHNSWQFTDEQKELAVARLRADGITGNSEQERCMTHWQALVAAVSDWRLWLLSAGYMTIIGSYSLSYFYPTLVNGLGYSSTEAQFMTAPLFVVAFVIAVPTCIFADRIPAYRPILACVALILGSLFCALSAGIYAYVPRYVFLCFINSAIWTANPLALSFASTSLAPVDSEVRAISLAWINGLGNLAQIYGAYLFPSTDKPKYLKGFSAYAGILFFGAFLYLSMFVLFRRSPFKPKASSS